MEPIDRRGFLFAAGAATVSLSTAAPASPQTRNNGAVFFVHVGFRRRRQSACRRDLCGRWIAARCSRKRHQPRRGRSQRDQRWIRRFAERRGRGRARRGHHGRHDASRRVGLQPPQDQEPDFGCAARHAEDAPHHDGGRRCVALCNRDGLRAAATAYAQKPGRVAALEEHAEARDVLDRRSQSRYDRHARR